MQKGPRERGPFCFIQIIALLEYQGRKQNRADPVNGPPLRLN